VVPRAGTEVSAKRRILPCQELKPGLPAPKLVTIVIQLSRLTAPVAYNFSFYVLISDLHAFTSVTILSSMFIGCALPRRGSTNEIQYLL
jgi:hypothetical protein